MEAIILVAAISFLATLLVTPKLMRFLRGCGIAGIDQQKKGKPRLPSSGGICVAFGLVLGLMVYIAIQKFLINGANLTLLLAASSTIMIVTLVGILDDINIKRETRRGATGTVEYRVGLPQWVKPLLTLPAAVPLMAVAAGDSMMSIPFIGNVQFGVLYPLLLVPIGVICVSNANNMLAGMNGLEAGMGFVASLGVGIYALMVGRVEGAVIALALSTALLAFLRYNWFPARILPGDSLTYLIGATFVTAIIIANVEMFAIFVYIPWIVEAFLKVRGRFAVSSLGRLRPDGTLQAQYEKTYSLTHVVMKSGRFREKHVTKILVVLEILIVLAAFWLFPAWKII